MKIYDFLKLVLSMTLLLAINIYGFAQGYNYELAGGTLNNHGNINTTFATMLVGGSEVGGDGEVPATQWFLNNADGGDYLVLRVGGTGGQASWVWDNFSSQISSAAELSINTKNAANNAIVAQYIRDAEALFVAGGDQTEYMSLWKGTAVEEALNYLINTKKVPIGGTSAGMAIMGGAYYAPANSGVLSSEILNNPYHSNTSNSLFYNDFLDNPYLTNVITDTHLDRVHGNDNENRYGRILGLLARTVADQSSVTRYAIGCDEATFVCIDDSGIARVFGDGGNTSYPTNAYFIQVNCQAPETISNGSALVWNNGGQAVKAYVIQGTDNGNGNSFNLNDWSSASGGGWMDWFTTGGYSNFNYRNGSGASTGANAPSCNGGGASCDTPSGLGVSNVTTSSATLSWSSTGADSYDIDYREVGASNWIPLNTSETSYQLTNLSQNTDYEFEIRSVCGSETSNFSSTAYFTTLSSGGGNNYCASSGNSTSYEYIDEVKIGSTSNVSGNDGGYGNYTSFNFNVNAGSSYTMTIYPETSDREIFTVWIDFNQDGDFTDANEEVLYAVSRRRARGTISIPSSALSGSTRMRVAMKYQSDGAPSSCENFSYGEVEDYAVTISGGNNRSKTSILNTASITPVLKVYPNPSSGVYFISGIVDNSLRAEVYNIDGKKILDVLSNKVDISNQPKGIYLLKVVSESESKTIRLLKE